ncbi:MULTISPECIES: LTA synthase family protein [unclassified Helicobacter]|uniref:LTA synthase family protein n=1 Tax=unclassified Helicobacter TaxID=2593540 RepID=UPI000CF122C4|nr:MULTISPECIES: alkaline phosphatase family protein [unclassified Helicobacter]
MLLKNILKTFSFILVLVILFIVLRIIFIIYVGIYHSQIGDATSYSLEDIFPCLFNGMQYDNRIIAIFGILYFVLSFIFKDKGLKVFASLVISLCSFLSIAHMLFFIIYHDVFNSNLLGFIFDDQIAILKTGFSGEYNLLVKVFMWLVINFAFIFFYKKNISFIHTIKTSKNYFLSLIAFISLALLLMFFINSAFSFKGKSLDQQIVPSKNIFLKKITTDNFRALYFVYKGYKVVSKSSLKDFYPKDIVTTTQEFFNTKEAPPYDLYELLKQEVKNTSTTPIHHIFYIVSESLSKWHFEERFDSIGLLSQTKKLIKDKKALDIDFFLENAPSTAKSLDSQITGLLQLDIPMHTLIGKSPTFQTSIASILKQLNYHSYFYYGGSGNWQKLDSFTHSQGFDKLFDESYLLTFAKDKNYPTPYKNIWGVSDNVLFDFILQNTNNTPSFNMIMTTSNHPPYDLPLEKYDVPMKEIEDFVEKNHLNISPKILAHIYWYDKVLMDFISKMSKKYPNSLFIITGDHYDRYYPGNASVAITKQVPCIIYSPVLNPYKTTTIGSHLDIAPTIIELVGKKGFQYPSFGAPLASNNPNFKIHNKLALGYFVIGDKNMIYEPKQEPLIIHPTNKTLADSYERLNQARALSWYLIFKGEKISND